MAVLLLFRELRSHLLALAIIFIAIKTLEGSSFASRA